MIEFIFYPLSLLRAEDYPQGYVGSGYREYLSDKMQNGYYVEVFTKMDIRQKERIIKRNQVEEILHYSYQATPQTSEGILAGQVQQKENSDNLKTEIANQRKQREQNASAQTEFIYIQYSDGKRDYFKDGLVTRAENERVLDEFGNAAMKNTFNMQYNDKRLLIGYEADLKDNLGNVSHLFWQGASYTPDSVFYGNKDTQANKNLNEYYLKEIDSAGNVKSTHWQATSYEGKLLNAFSQTIEDSLSGNTTFNRSNIAYESNNPEHALSYHEEGIGTDGLAYTSDRNNITYNDKDQLAGYHEEVITTHTDGLKVKSAVDAQFKYLAVANQFGKDVEDFNTDRLLESIITTTTVNPDGSQRTETATTKYDYDKNSQLIAASAQSKFNGQEASWYEYTDTQGHKLSMNEDENGNVIYYSYLDPDTLEVITVPLDEVTITAKDGNKYTGSSKIQYEVLYGKPMLSQEEASTSYYNPLGDLVTTTETQAAYTNGLINNLQRLLSSKEDTKEIDYTQIGLEGKYAQELRDIVTDYVYFENGNLQTAYGQGTGGGYSQTDAGWKTYDSTIKVDYRVILDKAKQTDFEEIKFYGK
jgi:hypothetical protein